MKLIRYIFDRFVEIELGSTVGKIDLLCVSLLIVMTAVSGFYADLSSLTAGSRGISVGHILAIGIVLIGSLRAVGKYYVQREK